MKYANSAAFRHALEDRLRTQSLKTGMPLVRLRKLVAFDRLLARLITAQPNVWVLKGGVALQIRLGDRASTTKDIDLFTRIDQQYIHDRLRCALTTALGDWLQFEVSRSEGLSPEQLGGALRFDPRSLFERLELEIRVGSSGLLKAGKPEIRLQPLGIWN